MNRQAILVMAASVCLAVPAQAKSADNATAPTITVTGLEVADKILKLDYQIGNNTKQDVWICDSVSKQSEFEVYMDEDAGTIVVRKRLDVPSSYYWSLHPEGRYTRLCPGQQQVESLLLTLPVNGFYFYYYGDKGQMADRVANATRLSLEIGYYVGNLPQVFSNMLDELEETNLDRILLFETLFGGLMGFNNRNEQLRQRDEQVLIPYTEQKSVGEQILRLTVDDITIPYRNTVKQPKQNPPDLSPCTRVEVHYEPSILGYFYPYRSQQDLLSRTEMERLNLEKTVIVGSAQDITDLANEIAQADQNVGGIVAERGEASVVGYRDGRRVISFVVYDDDSIETEQNQRIRYGSGLRSLRSLTPQIRPFELRMQCAANLKNLWFRMRLYDRAEKSRAQSYSNIGVRDLNTLDRPRRSTSDLDFEEIRLVLESYKNRARELYSHIQLLYPAPRNWCDSMEWAFVGPAIRSRSHQVDSRMKVHVCPSAGEGRSHYAMNPNCRPDSPGDMVLLFETKGGWNQHGGPELFTFDNHDPKGGCVLLNDGTVKFIRTAEELRQLRWKQK